MKDQEIIKKSDERKMKRFRQAATGNKLTTELQIRKIEIDALIHQSQQLAFLWFCRDLSSQHTCMFTVVSLAAQKFPGEKRMWDFLVTKLPKSQKQSTLAKQCYCLFLTESKCIVKHQSPLLTSLTLQPHDI